MIARTLAAVLVLALGARAQLDAVTTELLSLGDAGAGSGFDVGRVTGTVVFARQTGFPASGDLEIWRWDASGAATGPVSLGTTAFNVFAAPIDVAASDGGTWLVSWQDSTGIGAARNRVFRSDDDGITWAPVLTTQIAMTSAGRLATDHLGTWVLAVDTASPPHGIMMMRSVDDGLTWTTTTNLDATLTGFAGVDIATDGSAWMLAWTRINSGTVRVAVSGDGASWSPVLLGPAVIGPPFRVGLATDGLGTWRVGWSTRWTFPFVEDDVFVSASTNLGLSWSAPVNLAATPGDLIEDRFVDFAADAAGNWIAVWNTEHPGGQGLGNDFDVMASKLQAGDASWSAGEPIHAAANDGTLDDLAQVVRAEGLGEFLVLRSIHASIALSRLDLYALDGTDEDLRLETRVNSSGAPLDPVKPAAGNDVLEIGAISPGGALATGLPVVLVQLAATGALPTSPFPGIAVNPFDPPGVAVLFDGNTTAPPTPLGGGLTLTGLLPPGLSGFSLVVQGFALTAQAANGIFASTHGHELRFN